MTIFRRIYDALRRAPGPVPLMLLPPPVHFEPVRKDQSGSLRYDDLYGTGLVDDGTFKELSQTSTLASYQISHFVSKSRGNAATIGNAVLSEDYGQIYEVMLGMKNSIETLGLARLGLVCGHYVWRKPGATVEDERIRRRALALTACDVITETAAELKRRTSYLQGMRLERMASATLLAAE